MDAERESSDSVLLVLPTHLAWLTNDDAEATAAAGQRLDEALAEASSQGVAAGGTVGSDDDLLTVIGDALAQFPADEILLETRPDSERHWRVEDLAEKVRELHARALKHSCSTPFVMCSEAVSELTR
jgi:hypothetical protein